MWTEFLWVLLALIFGFKLYTRYIVGICKSKRRIDGKVVIVTGANTGIGFEAAKDMARRGGKVILACRDMVKANDACDRIKNDIPNAKVVAMKLDVGLMSSVREFCNNFQEKETRLDIIINNAGFVNPNDKTPVRTSEGLEQHFATNHLGHFLLTNILLGNMIATGGGRIVNVSSYGHNHPGKFDLNNLNSEKDYNLRTIYGFTKLCNIYFTREMDRRLRLKGLSPHKIVVSALHPGVVKTDIFRNVKSPFFVILFKIIFFFMKDCWEGAQTTIHCAISEELDNVSGYYYADCKKIEPSKLSYKEEFSRGLWERSEKYVGLKPTEYFLN